MKPDLKNKVILIAGASGGIGSAIVKLLSDPGASVVAAYFSTFPIQFKEDLNKRTLLLQADLTKYENWNFVVEKILKQFGKIDVLINCVGTLAPGEFLSPQINKIEKMVNTNILSVLYGIHTVLPVMKRQCFGHIINIGSLGGIVPMPYSAAYSATKFALRGFTYSIAQELKGIGIKISLVTPGSVKTKMLDEEAMNDKSIISFVNKPMNPDKVAEGVLKLIRKPKTEIIIPSTAVLSTKVITVFPKLLFLFYPLLEKTGIRKRKKYLETINAAQCIKKDLGYVS